MKKYFILGLLCISLTNSWAKSSDDRIKMKKFLEKNFSGIEIKEMNAKEPFLFIWELKINQQLNHTISGSGTFKQKIFLYHRGFKNPNVLVTEGYDVANRVYEPTLILDANQISVEYRFFGASAPEKINWNLLNHHQALMDLNYIHKTLSKIYKKRWVCTGISKGGTTAALYKLTYPKSIAAAVVYVAPFALEQEDKRTIDHYKNKVSTPECRDNVFQFQRNLLKKREELKPFLVELSKSEQVSFSLGWDKVIDYAAVEYPFSFWQWGFQCEEIPTNDASALEMYQHIEEVVDFNFYDDPTCASFLPAYYQFMTEYGYYGFDTTGLADLLFFENELSNLEFCPKGVTIKYDNSYILSMYQRAVNEGNNIIYIYGENDTWTSCGVIPSSKTNAQRFVKKDGGHRTRIRDLSISDKDKIYNTLQKWTRYKTKPLPY
ncbi:MAG: hypothetical protein M3Q56_05840 [Bacteroidota bacterium]|nr:hypothetical protein [Bacteroidota bacterium]